MYFPFFILHQRNKRSAIHPQTIYSEVPKISEKIARHSLPGDGVFKISQSQPEGRLFTQKYKFP